MGEVVTIEFVANDVSVTGKSGVVCVKMSISVDQLREIMARIERDGR